MATNLLGSVLAAAGLSENPLRIMNRTNNQRVAQTIKVLGVSFKFSSSVMRHMLEDGTTIADARVIQPTEVEIRVLCPTIDSVSQVLKIMNDRGSIYSITSRGMIVDSVMLSETTLKQSPENMSSAPFSLYFREALLESELKPITSQSGDASPVDRGLSSLNKAVDTVSSAARTAIEGGVASLSSSGVGGALASIITKTDTAGITGAIGSAVMNVARQNSPALNSAASLFDAASGLGNRVDVAQSVLRKIL